MDFDIDNLDGLSFPVLPPVGITADGEFIVYCKELGKQNTSSGSSSSSSSSSPSASALEKCVVCHMSSGDIWSTKLLNSQEVTILVFLSIGMLGECLLLLLLSYTFVC